MGDLSDSKQYELDNFDGFSYLKNTEYHRDSHMFGETHTDQRRESDLSGDEFSKFVFKNDA
jgi:hypothetical protein